MSTYLSYLYDKAKHTIITLRFSILAIFIVLFILTMSIFLEVSYIYFSRLTLRAAYLLMNQTSNSILYELQSQLRPAYEKSEFSASLIEHNLLNMNNQDQLILFMEERVKQSPIFEGSYWGDENGDFIYARKELDGSVTSEVIDRKKMPNQALYIYRDPKGNETKRTIVPLDYDPRNRPWYVLAKQNKKTSWTNVYLYMPENILGITAGSPVYKNNQLVGVFGLDISLANLSRYVANQKITEHSLIFIVDTNGRLIASSELIEKENQQTKSMNLQDISTISTSWIFPSFAKYQKHKQSEFSYKYKGQTYLANYQIIPDLAAYGWLIGIVAPEADFMGELNATQMIYIVLDIIVLIIGIFLVSQMITRVVHPIKLLVKETIKIKNFYLDTSGRIYSRIKEVNELSNAIYSMKMGLRSFQKYVPAALVRQLIEAGADVEMGGTKRELAIMFTDIQDFTSIAEKTEPNLLIEQIYEYFEAISRAILHEKGTIDKYIGDSIMAFWGAPVPETDPCKQAARAALHIDHRVKALNERWIKQGKPNFITRIGIHFGEAIVGNIGSSERLNYTALGDNVNISSRLEALGKLYGVSTIVTDSVYEKIKDKFILRQLDCVTLKGKSTVSNIYELIAEDIHSVTYDIESYRNVFSQAFAAYQKRQWQEAISKFKQCIVIYPYDHVAPVFIKRCEQFAATPPPTNWSGIWHLGHK